MRELEDEAPGRAVRLPRINGQVVMEDVDFAYDDAEGSAARY